MGQDGAIIIMDIQVDRRYKSIIGDSL